LYQKEKEFRLNRILMGSRVAEIDRKAISDGIDSKKLMKNAGTGVAKEIIYDYSDYGLKRSPRGVVISGGGNNGGDGFVAAGCLIEAGFDVKVFHVTLPEKFSSDSYYYYNKLIEKNPGLLEYLESADSEAFNDRLKKCDFIVDAIFGTGLHKNQVRRPALDIIDSINSSRMKNKNIRVYSVDIPSGVDSDNGKVLGSAVYADKTITFGCKKIGNINYPGASHNGSLKVLDIGIPSKYFEGYEKIFEPSLEWVSEKLPRRLPWTYKHRVGKLLVIAGSRGFTGAAAMTCMSAMRAGAGLVSLACPGDTNAIFEEKLTEVITYPMEQTDSVSLHYKSLDKIMDLAARNDAAVIGPGISREPETIRLVRELISSLEIPVLLDADGLQALTALNNVKDEQKTGHADLIITPHAGELSSIMGINKIPLEKRLEVNEDSSIKFRAVSVLKGAGTIISALLPGRKSGEIRSRDNGEVKNNVTSFINPTGNWGMASAGTGDILSGIIGSLLCQGMKPLEAAVCGTYIHGMAADIVSRKSSRTALIATDLLEGMKDVFLEIEKIKYAKEF
jgi:ADP-dependent NAD(P)H-hydrate dehydratase / NAD(P)H-hydrate epimerase